VGGAVLPHESTRSLITSAVSARWARGAPAIGAKLARPDADVWAWSRRGFQMTMAELGTMIQERAKVTIAIINNGCLGMVRQLQEFYYGGRYHATPLVNPTSSRSRARTHPRIRVTERAGVADAVEEAAAHDGPVLLDIRVEADDAVYPMVSAGAASIR